jgi:nitrite reductase (NO-forming)/hydroxylamine reductase
MVNFDDILTKEEINLMARYIQKPRMCRPSTASRITMDSWKVIVPVDQRPKKQMNNINLKNVFSVTLRDTGEVALIDGDTKEIRSIVKTGYAVHISRLSASGRYVYVIGRDGRLSLIDLWMEKPAVVAEVKIGFDARSVDTSKFKGFEDKYAVAGSYWPPQYVIMDGDTLKPRKVCLHPRHDGRWRIPPGTARGLHRGLLHQAGMGHQHQGNRPDPAGRLLGHREPQDHHHRLRQVPA